MTHLGHFILIIGITSFHNQIFSKLHIPKFWQETCADSGMQTNSFIFLQVTGIDKEGLLFDKQGLLILSLLWVCQLSSVVSLYHCWYFELQSTWSPPACPQQPGKGSEKHQEVMTPHCQPLTCLFLPGFCFP